MAPKDKKLLKIGIWLLLGIPLTILTLNDVPQLIRHLNGVNQSINVDTALRSYYMISLILIVVICIILLLSGSLCVARSILRWQKAKYLNIMTIIFSILIIFFVILLGVGIFLIAGIIWRGHL